MGEKYWMLSGKFSLFSICFPEIKFFSPRILWKKTPKFNFAQHLSFQVNGGGVIFQENIYPCIIIIFLLRFDNVGWSLTLNSGILRPMLTFGSSSSISRLGVVYFIQGQRVGIPPPPLKLLNLKFRYHGLYLFLENCYPILRASLLAYRLKTIPEPKDECFINLPCNICDGS